MGAWQRSVAPMGAPQTPVAPPEHRQVPCLSAGGHGDAPGPAGAPRHFGALQQPPRPFWGGFGTAPAQGGRVTRCGDSAITGPTATLPQPQLCREEERGWGGRHGGHRGGAALLPPPCVPSSSATTTTTCPLRQCHHLLSPRVPPGTHLGTQPQLVDGVFGLGVLGQQLVVVLLQGRGGGHVPVSWGRPPGWGGRRQPSAGGTRSPGGGPGSPAWGGDRSLPLLPGDRRAPGGGHKQMGGPQAALAPVLEVLGPHGMGKGTPDPTPPPHSSPEG